MREWAKCSGRVVVVVNAFQPDRRSVRFDEEREGAKTRRWPSRAGQSRSEQEPV